MTTPPAPFPPRLHVLLASNAPLGLVLRRGPSKQVATIHWDRHNDAFEVGQWLKGRIYERRSDLSPDGKYFLYFAMNGQWESEARGSWTAISRAPYLKALALFPKGNGWHGGGLWTGKRTYWLNDGYGHGVLRSTTEVQRDLAYSPPQLYGGECPGVYYPRLLRDGWTLRERIQVAKWKDVFIFEKWVAHGWALRKLAHAEVDAPPGKGVYWDEHELLHRASGETIACPDWEWAELDGKRLVWAAGGKLWAARLKGDGLMGQRELFDFRGMVFAPLRAPY
ncbi:MAG: hypothetical protein H0T73_07725 [Ardenticatenales bacterium]|nr:hypothetical protein [Ardenticatenales bacterium]